MILTLHGSFLFPAIIQDLIQRLLPSIYVQYEEEGHPFKYAEGSQQQTTLPEASSQPQLKMDSWSIWAVQSYIALDWQGWSNPAHLRYTGDPPPDKGASSKRHLLYSRRRYKEATWPESELCSLPTGPWMRPYSHIPAWLPPLQRHPNPSPAYLRSSLLSPQSFPATPSAARLC